MLLMHELLNSRAKSVFCCWWWKIEFMNRLDLELSNPQTYTVCVRQLFPCTRNTLQIEGHICKHAWHSSPYPAVHVLCTVTTSQSLTASCERGSPRVTKLHRFLFQENQVILKEVTPAIWQNECHVVTVLDVEGLNTCFFWNKKLVASKALYYCLFFLLHVVCVALVFQNESTPIRTDASAIELCWKLFLDPRNLVYHPLWRVWCWYRLPAECKTKKVWRPERVLSVYKYSPAECLCIFAELPKCELSLR